MLPPPTELTEEDLYLEAAAFMESYGADWPDEFVAQFRVMAETADHATMERWTRLAEIMDELHQPKH